MASSGSTTSCLERSVASNAPPTLAELAIAGPGGRLARAAGGRRWGCRERGCFGPSGFPLRRRRNGGAGWRSFPFSLPVPDEDLKSASKDDA
jgi:hypothetical protein